MSTGRPSKRVRLECLAVDKKHTAEHMLEKIGDGSSHVLPNQALAQKMLMDGFQNVAIESFASLGAGCKYPANIERDLYRFCR